MYCDASEADIFEDIQMCAGQYGVSRYDPFGMKLSTDGQRWSVRCQQAEVVSLVSAARGDQSGCRILQIHRVDEYGSMVHHATDSILVCLLFVLLSFKKAVFYHVACKTLHRFWFVLRRPRCSTCNVYNTAQVLVSFKNAVFYHVTCTTLHRSWLVLRRRCSIM